MPNRQPAKKTTTPRKRAPRQTADQRRLAALSETPTGELTAADRRWLAEQNALAGLAGTGAGTHEAQAAVEGAALVDKVTLNGASFRMADKIGLMPLILLAMAGRKGVDANSEEGLVAIYRVLQDCVHEDDFDAFVEHALASKADGDDLMGVVRDVIETLSARPTGSPRGSSAGRRATSANSKGSSSRTATVPEMVSVQDLLGH